MKQKKRGAGKIVSKKVTSGKPRKCRRKKGDEGSKKSRVNGIGRMSCRSKTSAQKIGRNEGGASTKEAWSN